MNIEEKVRNLIEAEIVKKNYILDEVKYEKEGSTYFLRIIIDKEGYVNIEDCITVNGIVGPILDKNNIIDNKYILDVCSKQKGCYENE